ncbi:hypothetical protein FJZ48_02810, partial [Candidatus Uhrbacteria bacterium]|nr:hypothetical protein [Candidatus Uhrbacteria bacterium]
MSSKLAKIVADFRTSLATKIAVGGTSATLQSITDDDLVVLPNGTYFFTLDGDSSKKEHIVCTLTGTALTNIKSVSRQGVQTVGVVREHRVGASVVITDFAHIRYLNDLLDKTTALDGSSPFKYDAEPTFVYGQHELVTWDKSKDYTDSVAVAGAPNLDENTKGIAEGATVSEQANGTDLGATGAHLILMSKNAKASSAGVADANKAVIAGADGLIDQTFLDKARTWSQVQTFTADSAQITTDPNSGNDPVRKSYADSNYNTINPFSAGSDGDVTINAPTTLSRDMYYNNLTLTG